MKGESRERSERGEGFGGAMLCRAVAVAEVIVVAPRVSRRRTSGREGDHREPDALLIHILPAKERSD
ncbi:hypothetical protein [Halococcus hamelinensis]|uniref:Uncharacterized protein n=1 Tax=Halococcus hamelinensis 100A6 TaxID=1132509 RepID=M0LWU5_9EURY|nr:hypothetical protein [Halococcus hamelinensis]EMA37941.1 hypothetical protein C447_10910 [Halococcus hamelinensis 100A6]